MNTQLMNKMLELMEEHFNEGDYVEGSKMMKSLYDDKDGKNDDLVKKIAILESDIRAQHYYIDVISNDHARITKRDRKALDEITKLVEEREKLLDETNRYNELLIDRLENRQKEISDVNEILQMLNIDRNGEYVEPTEKE